jgi:hypothetical protein
VSHVDIRLSESSTTPFLAIDFGDADQLPAPGEHNRQVDKTQCNLRAARRDQLFRSPDSTPANNKSM